MKDVLFFLQYKLYNVICFGVLISLLGMNSHARETLDEYSEYYEEYQVKALFLYNFANYTEWPMDAFKHNIAPISLCLFGDAPFSPFLDVFHGTRIGKRAFEVIPTLDEQDLAKGCQIIFLGQDKHKNLTDFFKEEKFVYILMIPKDKDGNDEPYFKVISVKDASSFKLDISNALKNGAYSTSEILQLSRKVKRFTTPEDIVVKPRYR